MVTAGGSCPPHESNSWTASAPALICRNTRTVELCCSVNLVQVSRRIKTTSNTKTRAWIMALIRAQWQQKLPSRSLLGFRCTAYLEAHVLGDLLRQVLQQCGQDLRCLGRHGLDLLVQRRGAALNQVCRQRPGAAYEAQHRCLAPSTDARLIRPMSSDFHEAGEHGTPERHLQVTLANAQNTTGASGIMC